MKKIFLICVPILFFIPSFAQTINIYGKWRLADIFSMESENDSMIRTGIGSLIQIDSNHTYTTHVMLNNSQSIGPKTSWFYYDSTKNIFTDQNNSYIVKQIDAYHIVFIDEGMGLILQKQTSEDNKLNFIFYGKIINQDMEMIFPASIELSNGRLVLSDSLGFFMFAYTKPKALIKTSFVGYLPKTVEIKANNFQRLTLTPDKNTLPNVTLSNGEGTILNDFTKKRDGLYACSKHAQRVAIKLFPYANRKILRAVKLGTDGVNSTMKLLIYETDETTEKPGKLLHEELISIHKKVSYLTLDKEISILGSSFFIALEWLDIDKNINMETLIEVGKKKKVKFINPMIRYKLKSELDSEAQLWFNVNYNNDWIYLSKRVLQIAAIMK